MRGVINGVDVERLGQTLHAIQQQGAVSSFRPDHVGPSTISERMDRDNHVGYEIKCELPVGLS